MKQQLQKKQWLAESMIYIFAAECVFGGSGRWLCFGSLSIRILLFLICFAVTLPYVIWKRKELWKNPFILVTIIFGLMVLVSAFIGIRNGNAVSFVWADISGFLTFALLPGMTAVIDTDKKLIRLLDVIFGASLLVAVITIGFHFALPFMSGEAVIAVNDWINAKNLGGFAMLVTGINRIYLRAQIFLQFSIIYGVWKQENITNKIQKVVIYIAEAIMLLADIISYTRGFWIGLAFSVLLVVILEHKYWKKLLHSAVMILAVFLIGAGISWACYGHPYLFVEVVNRFDSNLIVLSADKDSGEEQTMEGGTEVQINGFENSGTDADSAGNSLNENAQYVESVNEDAVAMRSNTLTIMHQNIAQRPILGWGLGKNLDGVREDGKTEYMYQDMMMKMGGLGLVLFLAAYFSSSAVHLIRRMKKIRWKLDWNHVLVRNTFLTAAFLGVAVTSAFNPFLTCPMGILMVSVVNLAVYENNESLGIKSK